MAFPGVLLRLLGALLAVAVGTDRAVAQIMGIEGVDLVARLTGPGSINNTPLIGIGGTDLGHMVVHQNRIFFLFGDTFSGDTATDGGHWRWNTVARSTDVLPADGILFDDWICDATGFARQPIYSGHQRPITEIPTGAISIGNRIYAWFMSVNWWGPPGQWTINYAGLAYSEDMGEHFTVVDAFRLPSTTNFGMVAASTRTDVPPNSDNHVYIWGTPSGRLGGVKLARVLPTHIADPASYRYFAGLHDGQPTWTANESTAPLIVPATVGEMSIMYNKAARRWMMLYFNHNRSAIEARQAVAPWGPWSASITVVEAADYPGLYGSYMNPVYVKNHGETIYFTMSLWVPYDVYLMRARLTVTNPVSPADLNVDGHVSASDVELFLPCLAGDSVTHADILACSPADFDRDGDVDQSDFATLQRCLGGLAVPADPACGR